MILYPGECVEPVANKGRFGQTFLNGHIGCTAQKSSREGLWMKKKSLHKQMKNVPKLKWNIHFYYILELTTHFQVWTHKTPRMGS